MKREVAMLRGGEGAGVERALHRLGFGLCSAGHGLGHLHRHAAVVFAVAAAAGGEIGVGVWAEREERRDRWKSEEQKQRDGEDAPHFDNCTAIKRATADPPAPLRD